VLVRSSEAAGGGRSRVDFSNVTLRIRVEDRRSGSVKLETRVPAGWLGPVANIVPQLVRSSYSISDVDSGHPLALCTYLKLHP
jgi:hypothetical protein